MRAERLVSIVLLLQTRGRMTALDLAQRLGVSERTIYRDMSALSLAGIPVFAERGPGGGCGLWFRSRPGAWFRIISAAPAAARPRLFV